MELLVLGEQLNITNPLMVLEMLPCKTRDLERHKVGWKGQAQQLSSNRKNRAI
jgi:hypothetical protein